MSHTHDTRHSKPNVKAIQSGFTLIEIMVVIVILTIFAGMITVSVGSTESRKNRAFYEHMIDSLSYVRLLSAERMQPMGLVLQSDNQGQVNPVIMALNNPYAHIENQALASGNRAKNSMELSGMQSNTQAALPNWRIEDAVTLPALPANVEINIIPLESPISGASSSFNRSSSQLPSTQQLQPWFVGTDVPQVLWFGTGEAAPARIEIRHNKRLVGDAITLLPDGRVTVGE